MQPPILCDGPLLGAGRRVIVFGDSWAGHRRMNAGIIAALGETTRACSIGFPGATTGQLVGFLDATKAALRDAAGGWATDFVLIGGINDFLNHRGEAYFQRNILDLAHHAHQTADRVHVLELPIVDARRQKLKLRSAVKRIAYRWVFERGQPATIEGYRRALPQGYLARIPYTPFADSFREADFHEDGVHMTPPAYERLGRYIGEQIGTGAYDAPYQMLKRER